MFALHDVCRMTYDDAITWLDSRGGSLAQVESGDGGQIVASAEGFSAVVTVKDISNSPEILRAEFEAILQLRQMLGD